MNSSVFSLIRSGMLTIKGLTSESVSIKINKRIAGGCGKCTSLNYANFIPNLFVWATNLRAKVSQTWIVGSENASSSFGFSSLYLRHKNTNSKDENKTGPTTQTEMIAALCSLPSLKYIMLKIDPARTSSTDNVTAITVTNEYLLILFSFCTCWGFFILNRAIKEESSFLRSWISECHSLKLGFY